MFWMLIILLVLVKYLVTTTCLVSDWDITSRCYVVVRQKNIVGIRLQTHTVFYMKASKRANLSFYLQFICFSSYHVCLLATSKSFQNHPTVCHTVNFIVRRTLRSLHWFFNTFCIASLDWELFSATSCRVYKFRIWTAPQNSRHINPLNDTTSLVVNWIW